MVVRSPYPLHQRPWLLAIVRRKAYVGALTDDEKSEARGGRRKARPLEADEGASLSWEVLAAWCDGIPGDRVAVVWGPVRAQRVHIYPAGSL